MGWFTILSPRPSFAFWVSLAPPLVSPLQLNRPHQASPRAAGVEAKAVHSPKIEASERGSCQEDPEGKGWPWTEDCEPSQCQHQLSNQHLPPWTEGLLLRPLCRPLCLRTFMHRSRSLCKPV